MSQSIGYARVSTIDQDPALQHNALTTAGCSRIFTDTASGAKADRPELAKTLDYLRDGDTLVVWKLDRLGRSLQHLIEVTNALAARGIGFRSLTEGMDTTTAGGRLIFNIFGALAEFERDLIRERTMAGLTAARAKGKMGGRPPTMSRRKITVAREMYNATDDTGRRIHTVQEIADTVGVSRTTIYRYLGNGGAA